MAKVKLVVDKLEDVDEALRGLYVEHDGGGFRLDYDGTPPELRSLQNALNAERRLSKDIKAKLKAWEDLGLDHDAVRTALSEVETLRAQIATANLPDNKERVQKLVEQQTEQMRKSLTGQIQQLTAALQKTEAAAKETTARLHRNLISQAVAEVALASGVKKSALADVQMRAERMWQIGESEDEIIALNKDGTMRMGKSGADPYTIKEWITDDLAKNATHLFEESSGGGSGGGSRPVARAGVIAREDKAAFGANLEKIARGEVVVSPGSNPGT